MRAGIPPSGARALLLALASGAVLVAGCRRIDGIEPPAACEGEEVTISGYGFGDTQGTSTVAFNGAGAGTAAAWSSTSIRIAVPAAASTGPVVLTFDAVPSPGVPFRHVECPAPGVSPTQPRIAVDPSGAPHLIFGQSGPTLSYIARPAGPDARAAAAWSPVEPIDTLASFDFAIAVESTGTPHVVYRAPDPSPDPPIAAPTYHRVRTGGAWSAPNVACPGELLTSEFCGDLRLAVEGDDLPVLFSKDADRYGANWIKRKKFDGATWPASTTIEYGSIFFNILGYDAIVDPLDSWHLGIWRNHFESPFDFFRRVEHSASGSKATLGQAASGSDDFSTPALAGSAGKLHLVWRDHATLYHRRFDLLSSTWDPAAAAFHTLSVVQGQRPLVTADPQGDDGAFAVWTEDAILYGAVYEPNAGTWSAPGIIAKDVSSPALATVAGTVHLVWRGVTTGDLRYATLP